MLPGSWQLLQVLWQLRFRRLQAPVFGAAAAHGLPLLAGAAPPLTALHALEQCQGAAMQLCRSSEQHQKRSSCVLRRRPV